MSQHFLPFVDEPFRVPRPANPAGCSRDTFGLSKSHRVIHALRAEHSRTATAKRADRRDGKIAAGSAEFSALPSLCARLNARSKATDDLSSLMYRAPRMRDNSNTATHGVHSHVVIRTWRETLAGAAKNTAHDEGKKFARLDFPCVSGEKSDIREW